jgi:hypothetical protein
MKYFQTKLLLRRYMFTNASLHILFNCLSFAVFTGCAAFPLVQEKREAVPTDMLVQAKPESAEQYAGKALQALSEAAKSNPASKEPWLEMAQMHFEAGDYGKAISAAQEVVQRDANDRHAYSILTVAGLRVAIASLSKLRKDEDKLPESLKNEAETLARWLLESPGKTVLVPQSRPVSTIHPSNKLPINKSMEGRAVAPIGHPVADTVVAVKTKRPQVSTEASTPVHAVDPFQALR